MGKHVTSLGEPRTPKYFRIPNSKLPIPEGELLASLGYIPSSLVRHYHPSRKSSHFSWRTYHSPGYLLDRHLKNIQVHSRGRRVSASHQPVAKRRRPLAGEILCIQPMDIGMDISSHFYRMSFSQRPCRRLRYLTKSRPTH